MNISGVVVRARPEQADQVKNRLLTLPGVEVHAQAEDGRMVVTVEQENDRVLADTVMGLQDIAGVLSASMIYHHFEEEVDTQEA